MVMSYVETRRFSTIFTHVGFLLGVFFGVFDKVSDSQHPSWIVPWD
jgi:hypothetical protein